MRGVACTAAFNREAWTYAAATRPILAENVVDRVKPYPVRDMTEPMRDMPHMASRITGPGQPCFTTIVSRSSRMAGLPQEQAHPV